ncbi:MAG: M15 family metallopeptidase [Bacteroidales bacterium]|nr:M15 family metallopeptidase [Bacteroidales bacterium]
MREAPCEVPADSLLSVKEGVQGQERQTSTETDGFVMLSEAVSDAIQEIRYYSAYNFVGTRIDGYEEPVALLTKEAAAALKAVSDDVMRQGYRLKIYDAYRPVMAVQHFRRWAADLSDTLMKADFYPNLPKSALFRLGYISSHSKHSRGSTVDLTLVDKATGKEVDMGGTFDLLDPQSNSLRREGITEQQFQNRMILRNAMVRHGFRPVSSEWWHFTLLNEPYPNTYFNFPVKSL